MDTVIGCLWAKKCQLPDSSLPRDNQKIPHPSPSLTKKSANLLKNRSDQRFPSL